jgi:bacillithiol synthase
MSEPAVRTEPLGGSPLTRALLDGGPASEWVAMAPRGADAWRALAGDVRQRGTGAWLETLRDAIAPESAAADRLARVAAGGGVLVTTGQQPGLFGGPIYTWSKALSALALADAIERTTGIPAAPMFWAATDDSDFAEAASTIIAVAGGTMTLRLPDRGGDDDRMLSHVPLSGTAPLVTALARGAGSAVHGHILDSASRTYRDGITIGDAYVGLMRAVLHPLGIGVLDASHPAVAVAARPLLAEALRRAEPIAAALASRDAEIRARQLAPQVTPVAGLTLVFRREGGIRSRIPVRDAAVLAGSSTELGPNVLLRPIAEREILPTVAYMAGPGELAYFAQVSAVADALGRPAPLALPRWSGTIIEPHIARILERHGLAPDDLRHPTAAESAFAKRTMPAARSEALERFRRQIDELATELSVGADDDDALVPPAVIEGHRRTLQHRVDRLERRLLAAIKRRHSETAHDLATARGALYPGGKRQERTLNLLPILARHGPRVLELMRERADEHANSLVAGDRVPAGAHR